MWSPVDNYAHVLTVVTMQAIFLLDCQTSVGTRLGGSTVSQLARIVHGTPISTHDHHYGLLQASTGVQ